MFDPENTLSSLVEKNAPDPIVSPEIELLLVTTGDVIIAMKCGPEKSIWARISIANVDGETIVHDHVDLGIRVVERIERQLSDQQAKDLRRTVARFWAATIPA